jgi:hypothetical protein
VDAVIERCRCHYYIKDFVRHGPNINKGGHKIYLSPKIPEDFFKAIVLLSHPVLKN